jgi:hypothetical protein
MRRASGITSRAVDRWHGYDKTGAVARRRDGGGSQARLGDAHEFLPKHRHPRRERRVTRTGSAKRGERLAFAFDDLETVAHDGDTGIRC